MAGQRQKRCLWTTEEDDKIKHFKTEYPNLPWGDIIERAKLNRDGKSCSHRWNNYLKSDFNDGEFSSEEDELIINLKRLSVSWESMAKDPHLPGRSPLAIKNRWNNYLKKRLINEIVRVLFRDDETSDHSVRGDDLEARVAEFAALITNGDPSETSDRSVGGDDL